MEQTLWEHADGRLLSKTSDGKWLKFGGIGEDGRDFWFGVRRPNPNHIISVTWKRALEIMDKEGG